VSAKVISPRNDDASSRRLILGKPNAEIDYLLAPSETIEIDVS
jgi:hypothetical protein